MQRLKLRRDCDCLTARLSRDYATLRIRLGVARKSRGRAVAVRHVSVVTTALGIKVILDRQYMTSHGLFDLVNSDALATAAVVRLHATPIQSIRSRTEVAVVTTS